MEFNPFEKILAKITKLADMHDGSHDRSSILSILMILCFSEDPRVPFCFLLCLCV